MIIDISSYNGNIDFETLVEKNNIERIIMRSTCKNGEPDSALSANISRLRKVDDSIPIDFYKFTYAKNYADAVLEATELLYVLKSMVLLRIPETLYIDIEPVNGNVQTPREIAEIIAGYEAVFDDDIMPRAILGIYCSYSYLKNMPIWSHDLPFWVARWNDTLGDTSDFVVKMWQYSDKGSLAGINGPVDLSRYV